MLNVTTDTQVLWCGFGVYMANRSRQDTDNVDYRSLAGFSARTTMSKQEGMDKKSVKSAKSGRSGRSEKSENKEGGKLDKEAKRLDEQLLELEKEIDNNPAYLEEVEENARRRMGDVFITDEAIPEDLSDKKFEELENTYKGEVDLMERRKIELERRGQLIEQREKICKRRRDIERMLAQQRLAKRETLLRSQETMAQICAQEREMEEREKKLKQKLLCMMEREPRGSTASDVVDEAALAMALAWTQQWVQQSSGQGKARTRRATKPPSTTGSQVCIAELEAQLKEAKQQLRQQQKAKAATTMPGGITQFKKLGLVPQDVPEAGETSKFSMPPDREELKKLHLGTEEPQLGGKQDFIPYNCELCQTEKPKVKSGKYVKSNINIKVQEQWPHLNVLREYVRRTTFDQLDFETFVAGET